MSAKGAGQCHLKATLKLSLKDCGDDQGRFLMTRSEQTSLFKEENLGNYGLVSLTLMPKEVMEHRPPQWHWSA